MGVHIFTKTKNTDDWKKKNFFSVTLFLTFLVFPIWTFEENAQCFVGASFKIHQIWSHELKGHDHF